MARLARRGVGLIALALAVLFVLQLSSIVLLLARYAPDQERYTRAVAAANLANTGLLDEETALRAFLATHDQTFLDTYSVGQREVADGNLQMAALLGGDKNLADDLAAVATAQQTWTSGWAFPALSGADVATGASLPQFLVRGKLLFDNYRQKEAALRSRISAQQTANFNEQNNVLTATRALGLFLLTGVLVFGAIAAERLRGRIEKRFGGPGNHARVTASFGVAALGPGVETAADLVGVADNALYQAKEAGRNRVVVAADHRERPAIRPVG